MRVHLPLLVACALITPFASCAAQDRPELPVPTNSATARATTGNSVGRFPFLEVDARARQVRVECEALAVENPLEFFCCLAGTVEHESVLRSKVRPSNLHAALLMLGLEPGEPVHFSESAKKWLPPHGPPLQISVEFEKGGKRVALPAYRLMRDAKTLREMPPMTWIFAGSRVMPGDVYAADRTGYIVSVVNFDYSVIDIPQLASNANETLEWQTNLDAIPPKGSKVTMIIEPAGQAVAAPPPPVAPATQAKSAAPAAAPIDVALVAIDPAGKILLDGEPVATADALTKRLTRGDGTSRHARVALANTVEENPTARDVINALSRSGVRFDVVPQASALAPNRPAGASTDAAADGGVHVDEEHIRKLREKWQQAVAPHDASLRQAATTHYEVITELRREQQRLIDEADKVQRLIDDLEKQYQDMTTPRPQ
jgi:hypothetical protein